MTLASQLDEEEPCMLYRQRILDNLDALAIPMNELVPVRTVQGRMDDVSARQQESWGMLNVRAEWEFVTLDLKVINGDVIQVPPSEFYPQRYMRVTGTASNFRRKGNIEDHLVYPAVEIRIT